MNKTNASFGELLKTFRKRRSLSQKQLAAALNIHYNSIGVWERGSYLPKNKTTVLELAHQLSLDEQETRQLLEASFTTQAPYWGVPFPRNPFFTGREEILEALYESLHANPQVTAHTQLYALHGLGGVGKTQVALEYAYRHAPEYSAVFWISAETVAQILSSMRIIAQLLDLDEQAETDPQRSVAAVLRWLATHKKWLLIWDGLENLEMLQRFLPPLGHGTLLLTTRHQAFGGLAYGIDLLPMKQEEGILFLLRRTRLLGQETLREQLSQLPVSMLAEYAEATALVTELGGLPLAIDQVGAYLEETGCTLTDCLHLYEQQVHYLLDRRGVLGGTHPQSVAATFRLSIERVEQEQREAVDLLHVCAFLHEEAIPEELFVDGGTYLGSDLASMVADRTRFNQALTLLRSLSLIQRRAETHTLSLHRLIQLVLQASMTEQERNEWLKRVIKALNAVFPEVTCEVWPQCERLLPHVLRAFAAFSGQDEAQEMTSVMRKAVDYLRERSQYEQAEVLDCSNG